MQIDHVLAIEVRRLRVAISRLRDKAIVRRFSPRAVENIVDVVVGRNLERIEIERLADAAELVSVSERLIRPRQAYVIGEHAVGRRSGDFDGGLMVEGRPADAEVGARIAGKSSRLDDLID